MYAGIGLVIIVAGILIARRKTPRGKLAPVRNIADARPAAAPAAATATPPASIPAPTTPAAVTPASSPAVDNPLANFVAAQGGNA
jgi:hypothetical protein